MIVLYIPWLEALDPAELCQEYFTILGLLKLSRLMKHPGQLIFIKMRCNLENTICLELEDAEAIM